MSNTNDATHPEWRQLCQAAFFELDAVKLVERIAEARRAILDRVEDNFSKPGNGEQYALRNALETLNTLQELAERDIRERKKPVQAQHALGIRWNVNNVQAIVFHCETTDLSRLGHMLVIISVSRLDNDRTEISVARPQRLAAKQQAMPLFSIRLALQIVLECGHASSRKAATSNGICFARAPFPKNSVCP